MEQELLAFVKKYGFGFRKSGTNYYFFNCVDGRLFLASREAVNSFSSVEFRKKFLKSDLKSHKEIMNLLTSDEISKADSQIPFHIQWHLNETCNLRCKHCYQEAYQTEGLAFEQMKEIVDKYFIAINRWGNLPEFSLTGGEPLLNKNLFLLVDYIRSKDPSTSISILTNGTLIDDVMIGKLRNAGIKSIQLSLEGSTKEINDSIRGEGVFEKVTSVAKKLVSEGFKVSFHFVLSKKNAHDVINYIDLSRKIGVKLVTISNLVPFGNGEKMKKEILSPLELKKIYKKIDDYIISENISPTFVRRTRPLWCLFSKKKEDSIGGECPVALSTLTIMADGKVLPCRRFNLEIGDLMKQNFFEIWYGSDVLWDLRDRKKISGCGKCKHLEKCGGCRGLAYAIYGDYLAKDPQCWIVNKAVSKIKSNK